MKINSQLQKIEASLELTQSWMLDSGIQNTGRGYDKGAFYSWFDISKNSFSFAYPEITGYGITALLYLNDKRAGLLKKAIAAADWLIKNALHDSGGIKVRTKKLPGESSGSHISANLLYTFDSGMVLSGLVNLCKYTKNKYLKTAKRIAGYLVNIQRPDGSFPPIIDSKTGKVIDTQDKWSTQSGSFHAKLSIGLLGLFDLVKVDKYRESSLGICEYALKFQQPNGRIITSQIENSTHLHPHCYAVEGILYSGLRLNKKAYLEASKRAMAWVLDNQKNNGGIPCKCSGTNFISYERTDILAQTLRLGVLLYNFGMLNKGYGAKIEKLFKRLICFQVDDKPKSERGGFRYGYELDGKQKFHVNSWCSMFSLQALEMYKHLKQGDKHINLDLFI